MLNRMIGAYGVVIAALFGCAATVEEPEAGAEAPPSQAETSVKTEGASALSEAQAGAIERTQLEQSRVLTLARRKEFHAALAERLELSGDQKRQFLSLLEAAEVERLRDTDEAGEEAARSRRVAHLKELGNLLGADQLERFNQLRETKTEWFRPSHLGRSANVPHTQRADEGSAR